MLGQKIQPDDGKHLRAEREAIALAWRAEPNSRGVGEGPGSAGAVGDSLLDFWLYGCSFRFSPSSPIQFDVVFFAALDGTDHLLLLLGLPRGIQEASQNGLGREGRHFLVLFFNQTGHSFFRNPRRRRAFLGSLLAFQEVPGGTNNSAISVLDRTFAPRNTFWLAKRCPRTANNAKRAVHERPGATKSVLRGRQEVSRSPRVTENWTENQKQ